MNVILLKALVASVPAGMLFFGAVGGGSREDCVLFPRVARRRMSCGGGRPCSYLRRPSHVSLDALGI
jgi:hypothetical protein